jgi:hypothetical protein
MGIGELTADRRGELGSLCGLSAGRLYGIMVGPSTVVAIVTTTVVGMNPEEVG